ncbi:MAG: hypothetical protein IJZ03_03730 [Clostridia bacterium]|nr:hypothetical protein [Clostridia bacterium]MBQ9749613.1 hypothetical protein [Clostridia bacterium]
MKRIFAILLCLATLLTGLVGCANKNDEGPTIDIYMDETYSFDPALAYNDTGAAQMLSLTYEGLFKLSAKGSVKKALCSDYKIKKNDDGSQTLIIKLGESYWSDGVQVDAADFVYAWNRIIDPEFKCEAASLLFPVKNAVEVKNGNISIDDVGFYSSGTYEITINLEKGVDAKTFLSNLTSVALYPLRKEVVRSVKDENWGSLAAVLVANGPFYVKAFDLVEEEGNEESQLTILERNQYYRREPDAESALSKYVKPYRLRVHHVSPEKAYEMYQKGKISFTSEIPLAKRKELLKKVELIDNMFTYSYMFNTANELFANADVRKALSISIDRNKIEEIVVFAEAADSLISEGVYETKKGTSFHQSLISTSAKFKEAEDLIKKAGAKGKKFTLAIYDDPTDIAVAKYCVEVWKKLGLNVDYKTYGFYGYDYTEKALKTDDKGNRYWADELIYANVCGDELRDLYNSGKFDVIAVNYNMLSSDAFAVLAQFAPKYSGGAYDLSVSSEEWPYILHTSAYNSEKYAKLIDEAHKSTDPEKRAEKLKEAEKLLVKDDCVVVPLYFGKTAYLSAKNVKKISHTSNGLLVWTVAKDKNYKPVKKEKAE